MSEQDETRAQRRSNPVPWRLIFVAIILAAIALFIVENNHRVDIRFVGRTQHASLAIALLISAVLGALLTLSIQHHRRHRRLRAT